MTPLFGIHIAKVILTWWSEGGPSMVRAWAALSLAIGAFIIYAVAPRR